MNLSSQWIDNAVVSGTTYADEKTYHALFSRLRRHDPVHWSEPEGVRPFWVVAKYADIMEVERQPEIFISAPRFSLDTIESESLIRKATGGRCTILRSILTMDGDEHSVYRGLTQQWFMPKRLSIFESVIDGLAMEAMDNMGRSGGECDFVSLVAEPFPLRVVMRLLDIPLRDEQKMLRLTQEILGSRDPRLRKDGSEQAILSLMDEFTDYFCGVSEQRRREPQDDLATAISTAKLNGQMLTDLEVASYFIVLMAAGHDTTSSSASGGLLALLQNKEAFSRLRSDTRQMPAAIDEMIRWVAPAKHFFRTAVVDYELRGKMIRAGDSLMMCYPSANRDEDVFDEPFEFRIDRGPNRHLSFGYGPHQCLGQFLAKMEMKILFHRLLERYEEIELAGRPVRAGATFMNGLTSLPIRFSRD